MKTFDPFFCEVCQTSRMECCGKERVGYIESHEVSHYTWESAKKALIDHLEKDLANPDLWNEDGTMKE